MKKETVTNEPPWSSGDVSSITVLIQEARTGDDDARAKVLRKLQPFIISMAAQHNDLWFCNKQGVSDIVQQSFVKVIENFESFQGSSSAEFRGWLKRLVINEIRQINRNLNRKRRDVKREQSLEQDPARRGHNVSTDDPTPEATAMLNEQLARLRSVMDELDETPKRVIELRAFDNLTFREIAKQMGKSQDAVTKIWYRSLIQLQKHLSGMDLY